MLEDSKLYGHTHLSWKPLRVSYWRAVDKLFPWCSFTYSSIVPPPPREKRGARGLRRKNTASALLAYSIIICNAKTLSGPLGRKIKMSWVHKYNLCYFCFVKQKMVKLHASLALQSRKKERTFCSPITVYSSIFPSQSMEEMVWHLRSKRCSS